MKKKIVFACGIVVLLLISFLAYRQTLGAPIIGVITGPEWEYLIVNGINYERDNNAPVNGADRGHFMGVATNGDTRFRVYSIIEAKSPVFPILKQTKYRSSQEVNGSPTLFSAS